MTNDAQTPTARPAPRPARPGLRAGPPAPTIVFTGSDGGIVRTVGTVRERLVRLRPRGRHRAGPRATASSGSRRSRPPITHPQRRTCRRCSSRVVSVNPTTRRQRPAGRHPGQRHLGERPATELVRDHRRRRRPVRLRRRRRQDPLPHATTRHADDVNFDGGDPARLGLHQRPAPTPAARRASFYVPLMADPTVRPARCSTACSTSGGRTDNGGDQAFLDAYCNEISGDYVHSRAACGDWVPLGAGASGDLLDVLRARQGRRLHRRRRAGPDSRHPDAVGGHPARASCTSRRTPTRRAKPR